MQTVEDYCSIKSIPATLPRRIDHYLNMERSELSQHTTIQLYEIQFEIQTHLYYVQTVYNQQMAKVDKCRFEIDRIITPRMDNYSHIYGKDEKRNSAVFDDEHAIAFRKIEVMAQAAATRMTLLTQRLDNICRTLDNIARRRHDGEK